MPLRGWRAILGCLALIALAGCGSPAADYKVVYAELIRTQDELLETLKTVHDKASMENAAPKLRRIGWRSEALKKKRTALPKPSEEVQIEVETEFKQPLEDVLNKLQKETERIKDLPGGEEFLKSIRWL